MVKKVKVLREMPFVNVGDEFKVDKDGHIISGIFIYHDALVDDFISDGWLAWEEPKCKICNDTGLVTVPPDHPNLMPCSCQEESVSKSLEDKIHKYMMKFMGGFEDSVSSEVSQIARSHFLEKFDKVSNDSNQWSADTNKYFDNVHKAMFGEE